MKKLLLVLALSGLFGIAAAQDRAHVGVRAGLNVANMTFSSGGANVSPDSRALFHVGVAYDHVLSRHLPLYLETGLYLSGRGGSVGGDLLGSSQEIKMNMLYLQVPVLASWHFDLGAVTLQPSMGLFYGFGISGKLKSGAYSLDLFDDVSVETSEGTISGRFFKHSDLGLRFGLGALVKRHFYVGLGYDCGLLNINYEPDDIKVRNGSFFLSVGYNF